MNPFINTQGFAKIGMLTVTIGAIINIILDPMFIFGIGPFPKLGIEGAAVATIIGRSLGILYQLYHLNKGKGLIVLSGIFVLILIIIAIYRKEMVGFVEYLFIIGF